MNNLEELRIRWEQALRFKAQQYEHPARKSGEVVTSLDLDTLANEINAFFTALQLLNK